MVWAALTALCEIPRELRNRLTGYSNSSSDGKRISLSRGVQELVSQASEGSHGCCSLSTHRSVAPVTECRSSTLGAIRVVVAWALSRGRRQSMSVRPPRCCLLSCFEVHANGHGLESEKMAWLARVLVTERFRSRVSKVSVKTRRLGTEAWYHRH